jgi:hypothetical protein
MASCLYAPVALECDPSNSDSWDDLYRLLCSQVKVLNVFNFLLLILRLSCYVSVLVLAAF